MGHPNNKAEFKQDVLNAIQHHDPPYQHHNSPQIPSMPPYPLAYQQQPVQRPSITLPD